MLFRRFATFPERRTRHPLSKHEAPRVYSQCRLRLKLF
jgi:hypothetical protein